MTGHELVLEFCSRSVCGLAFILAALNPQGMDPWYFRTQSLVVLALALLGWLNGGSLWLATAGFVAWCAFVAWSVGRSTGGRILLGIVAALATGELAAEAWKTESTFLSVATLWELSDELASGLLMGSVFATMLLGHWYLIWPGMSLTPLKRFLRAAAWVLGARALFWGHQLLIASHPANPSDHPVLWVLAAFLLGWVGTAVAVGLAWRCARIQSTQAATGILYAGVVLALLGELLQLVRFASGSSF
jgi:hypothetical protein